MTPNAPPTCTGKPTGLRISSGAAAADVISDRKRKQPAAYELLLAGEAKPASIIGETDLQDLAHLPRVRSRRTVDVGKRREPCRGLDRQARDYNHVIAIQRAEGVENRRQANCEVGRRGRCLVEVRGRRDRHVAKRVAVVHDILIEAVRYRVLGDCDPRERLRGIGERCGQVVHLARVIGDVILASIPVSEEVDLLERLASPAHVCRDSRRQRRVSQHRV